MLSNAPENRSGPDYCSFSCIASCTGSKYEERMKMFAATDAEGSRDGLVSPAEFCKPTGLCVEFDHVLSMCDAQTNCIRVFTTLY